MQVRIPTFDSSTFRAQWAPNREFAQFYNAFSVVPAHIEPYLIKVMTRALKVVPEKHTDLRREMDIFIKQETQHCKQHVAFNRFLHKGGYEGMLAIEQEYKNEYIKFLDSRSLKFNLAYCEGFETLGWSSAEVWFSGELDPLIKDADPYAVQLWKWHLAEEFEHRTVCFDVFHTLYGKGFFKRFFNGYLYRVYGFFYAATHIDRYTQRVARYLIGVDNANASPEELKASQAREKAMMKIIRRATLPRLANVLSPFYNPGRRKMPANMSSLLKHYAEASRPATAAT
jgi:predicted metal-dependent hydrolase